MKTTIAALLIALLASPAYAAMANFTGRQEQVRTVTNQMAWKCQYHYLGQYFWQIHQTSCPSMVEVQ